MKFWFFAIFVSGAYAFTDSLIERGDSPDHLQSVLIKGIADDGERVRVSLVPVSSLEEGTSSKRETVELCSSLYQPFPFDSEEDPTARELLKQALEKGQEIRVQYEGSFSRCIAEVQIPKGEI